MEANGIVLSPDPRLRQECAVIEEITPAIEALAEKMKKMMFENGGCGLAAPQIGELIQLVTIDCDYSDKSDYDPYVLINPVIVEQSDHLVPFSEGCLSIPGISCEIERPDHVVVEAYDLDANLIRYEASGDLFCVCLQHEIDHLHGNTMFERLKPMQRLKAVKEYQDALARGARPRALRGRAVRARGRHCGGGQRGRRRLDVVHGRGGVVPAHRGGRSAGAAPARRRALPRAAPAGRLAGVYRALARRSGSAAHRPPAARRRDRGQCALRRRRHRQKAPETLFPR